jgi:hypothetical protein
MAAVNSIHQKFVKKTVSTPFLGAMACCMLIEAQAMLVAVFIGDASTNSVAQERKTRAKSL